MKPRASAIDVPEGQARKTPRKKIKRCKYCQKQLSLYNENDFCFAHVSRGFKMLLAQEEEKKFKASVAQKKFIEKKKRDKKSSK